MHFKNLGKWKNEPVFLDFITEAVQWDRNPDYTFRDYEVWHSDYEVSGCAKGKWYDIVIPRLSFVIQTILLRNENK